MARIFLGGFPGAGKTYLTRYLVQEKGWSSLDMDGHGANPVLELLDSPEGHPAFAQDPLVVEGGFLQKAHEFQRMIDRHGLVTFWLFGTFAQLRDSRLSRMASWDDPASIRSGGWMELVESYASWVRWDHGVTMWNTDGTRKTPESLSKEIEWLLDTP